MVAISRQYLSGADRVVQIGQAVFVNKGTQPELAGAPRGRVGKVGVFQRS